MSANHNDPVLVAGGGIGGLAAASLLHGATPRRIASGHFTPTWESLAGGYQAPDWFRDAKFGIWAHYEEADKKGR